MTRKADRFTLFDEAAQKARAELEGHMEDQSLLLHRAWELLGDKDTLTYTATFKFTVASPVTIEGDVKTSFTVEKCKQESSFGVTKQLPLFEVLEENP